MPATTKRTVALEDVGVLQVVPHALRLSLRRHRDGALFLFFLPVVLADVDRSLAGRVRVLKRTEGQSGAFPQTSC